MMEKRFIGNISKSMKLPLGGFFVCGNFAKGDLLHRIKGKFKLQ